MRNISFYSTVVFLFSLFYIKSKEKNIYGGLNIQGVPGGMCETSGECSLC